MAYLSDDGVIYTIATLLEHVTSAGGAVVAGPGNLLKGYHPRHVLGKASDGTRASLIMPSPSNTLYINGGTFNLYGVPYDVQGRIGERRFAI
jgi:hypothetical protein